MNCLFCQADLSAFYHFLRSEGAYAAPDAIHNCPHCGVCVTFTSDLSDVADLIADALRLPTEQLAIRAAIAIPLYDDAGTHIDDVSLVCGWNPNELLSPKKAAEISQNANIYATLNDDSQRESRFPNARKDERGKWRIPRKDLH